MIFLPRAEDVFNLTSSGYMVSIHQGIIVRAQLWSRLLEDQTFIRSRSCINFRKKESIIVVPTLTSIVGTMAALLLTPLGWLRAEFLRPPLLTHPFCPVSQCFLYTRSSLMSNGMKQSCTQKTLSHESIYTPLFRPFSL